VGAETQRNRRWWGWLGNAGLAVLGAAVALAASELLLRAFPNWMPREVRVSPPVRRVSPQWDRTYEVYLSSGDLFHYMRGHIAPLEPDQDKVLAQVRFVSDANGFRNAGPAYDNYDLVALGDSFTVAPNAPTPWPQGLAQAAGLRVLNLGEAGTGPQEELAILRQYGRPVAPRWVVLAYFEGNDLYDAGAYGQANPFLVARLGRYLLRQAADAWQASAGGPVAASPASSYQYPVPITFGGREQPMAFFSAYISWLSVNRATLAASRNYRLTTETFLQMRALTEAAGARFLLVYVPSKAHVYLPQVSDPATLARIFRGVTRLGLDPAGYVAFTGEPMPAAEGLRHLDDQAGLLADFAAVQGIPFLDLTPAFQAAAGQGEELYSPYDTHWNQRGHDLAAEQIAGFLGDMP
jgi:hypothetical protein